MEKATTGQCFYDGEDYEPSESEAGGVTIDGIVAQEAKTSFNPWRKEPSFSASNSGSTTPTPRQNNGGIFQKTYPDNVGAAKHLLASKSLIWRCAGTKPHR